MIDPKQRAYEIKCVAEKVGDLLAEAETLAGGAQESGEEKEVYRAIAFLVLAQRRLNDKVPWILDHASN